MRAKVARKPLLLQQLAALAPFLEEEEMEEVAGATAVEAEAEAVKTKTATINTPGGKTVALKSDDAMPTKKRSEDAAS